MATFEEVFWEMFRRVEESDSKLKEKDLIIEELEYRIADLENQLGKFKKMKRQRRKANEPNSGV